MYQQECGNLWSVVYIPISVTVSYPTATQSFFNQSWDLHLHKCIRITVYSAVRKLYWFRKVVVIGSHLTHSTSPATAVSMFTILRMIDFPPLENAWNLTRQLLIMPKVRMPLFQHCGDVFSAVVVLNMSFIVGQDYPGNLHRTFG